MDLKYCAQTIMEEAIRAMSPGPALRRALGGYTPPKGKTLLLAAGKAAWEMAETALSLPGFAPEEGLVITKHGYSKGPLAHLEVWEAGHPLLDEHSVAATRRAVELVTALGEEDRLVLLLSGGASALLEWPKVPLEELIRVTRALLEGGADIREINCIRKRLSYVKGGRLALLAAPARVQAVILSDVVGDDVSSIASGPVSPDTFTCRDAQEIAQKYDLPLSPEGRACLLEETPKDLPLVDISLAGGSRLLARTLVQLCRAQGFSTHLVSDCLGGEAGEQGIRLAALIDTLEKDAPPTAFVATGETVVHVRGRGKGGRCQQLALTAARHIRGKEGVLVSAFGTDGTDGPTPAAGGWCDGTTWDAICRAGIDPEAALCHNDAYHALQAADCLWHTGPTGTNVNDGMLVLWAGKGPGAE